jgi:hypothetical protein
LIGVVLYLTRRGYLSSRNSEALLSKAGVFIGLQPAHFSLAPLFHCYSAGTA